MNEKDLLDKIGRLAQLIISSNKVAEHAQGELIVLSSAIYALVRTHPDPEAFAAAFRSAWTTLGSRHSDEALGEEPLAGIDAVLSLLEGASRVPLQVRPPDVANAPDD